MGGAGVGLEWLWAVPDPTAGVWSHSSHRLHACHYVPGAHPEATVMLWVPFWGVVWRGHGPPARLPPDSSAKVCPLWKPSPDPWGQN